MFRGPTRLVPPEAVSNGWANQICCTRLSTRQAPFNFSIEDTTTRSPCDHHPLYKLRMDVSFCPP